MADIALAGQVFAPHYARPISRSCGMRAVSLRPEPDSDAPPSSELLPGEGFAVLEVSGGWAWGYCEADHYVGYVEADALTAAVAPTHMISSPNASLLSRPDESAPVAGVLPMAARLQGREGNGFLAVAGGGFLSLAHLRRVDAPEQDAVAVAERLVGAPYRLGGRSFRGIDCSGLVQVSLGLCGIQAPRDSDQQRSMGRALPARSALKRGDLIFFEGHVGLMMDDARLIHATAHCGEVTVEPLATVAARKPILDRRRLEA